MPLERVYSELYRSGSLGSALIEALDDMATSHEMEPQLAGQILRQFDKTMEESFRGQTRAKMSHKGHLRTYRLCDDIWSFDLRDIDFKMDNGEKVHVKRMKAIAFSSDRKETYKRKED
ncbi:transcription initiation factor IIA gamma chain [Podospora aff. communis PSN243]|uniref:Transcription initiation factor IIA subunit 2 n=1 Tax=Podospora aff. communis PSN243 TaxID=3040156 RepID=A0AAV9GGJ2_9PEZI|nr:transcription initiation factor IIA gamma chain [Podospora aff. communis PSN243]